MVADSQDEILQWAYENARTRATFVICIVVPQILFLLRQEVMDNILDEHTSNYFHTSNTADKVSDEPLSTSAFMVPISSFTQRRTGETVLAKHVFTKMEELLKFPTVDADAKRVRQKLVSWPSRVDLASSYSPPVKKDYTQADRCRLGSAPTLTVVTDVIEKTRNGRRRQ